MAVMLVVPSMLKQTQGLLAQSGLLGELLRVGVVGGSFAALV